MVTLRGGAGDGDGSRAYCGAAGDRCKRPRVGGKVLTSEPRKLPTASAPIPVEPSVAVLEPLTRERHMQPNMGTADRAVRILVAVAIAILYFTGRISGGLAAVLGVVAVAFVLTSLVGRCPAYMPFGFSTCKRPG
jgi:hypothetical protein